MTRHQLTFRGESHVIPASFGLCTQCGRLVQLEAWLAETCPGRVPQEPATEAATREE